MTDTIREALRMGREYIEEVKVAARNDPLRLKNTLADLATIDAALGESKPKVPMAMLRDIHESAFGPAMPIDSQESLLREIAARYGFEVDDSPKEE